MAALPRAYEIIEQREKQMELSRRTAPYIRLWDGNWNLIDVVADYIECEFEFLELDAGLGTVQLFPDHPVARMLSDHTKWPTKSIYLTMDKDGARWSGRVTSVKSNTTAQDVPYLEITATHDYQKLKELLAWANPFLPAAVQFPKAWFWWGPSKWNVSWLILANLIRKNLSLWLLPDNPWDVRQWFDYDQSNWSEVVLMPDFFRDYSMPCTLTSRFKTVHETIENVCIDSQLSIDMRRYLPGDPHPAPGKSLRQGCLVIQVVDKSGWQKGTAITGSFITGLVRAVQRVGADGLSMTEEWLPNVTYPAEYDNRGFLGTLPEAPWVVLKAGKYSTVDVTSYEYKPPGPSHFVAGGRSMPGVNEVIKATVIGLGGLLGTLIGFQTQMGSVANAILEPLYTDVFLAFRTAKHLDRIRQQGWDYPFEHWVDSVDQAYSLSGFAAVRRAYEETRERHVFEVEFHDGAPYYVGQQGQGDFFLGDRVAVHAPGMPEGHLKVERVSKLRYRSSDKDTGWKITVGDRSYDNAMGYVAKKFENFTDGLKQLGVW